MRSYNDELMHYGILGMKWGVRRYQNKDGTLTAAGRRKYKRMLKKNQKIDKRIEGVRSKYQDNIDYYTSKSNSKNNFYDMRRGGEYSTPDDAKREKEWYEYHRDRHIKRLNDKRPSDFTKNKDFPYKREDGTLTAAGRRKHRKDQKEYRDSLRKEYGKLEDQYTYGPTANKRKNSQLDKRMHEIDDELSYRKLKIDNSDTAVTKRVKNDYNTMTNKQFMSKYQCSKNTYAKRVKKYKDPYRQGKRRAKIAKKIL